MYLTRELHTHIYIKDYIGCERFNYHHKVNLNNNKRSAIHTSGKQIW